ncbi:helix-turn-helix domain-containing protein [Actinomadura rubrisoli]|uniref:helix-turn-helix domain-containing protein n=1 Tax=Actinomadura rubrisoli TaxID=2530368 RepID=UPI001A9EA691|nr:winged helix-turn-helix domain-containing protein [Actinomadura rubrisoli]
MTAQRRVFRERVRLQAAELFATGSNNAVIARELRVGVRSVQRWRKAWSKAGPQGLSSKGSPGRPKLSPRLWAMLEAELEKGPVAHGWPDQTWTLSRIQTVIGRRFHKSMSLAAICQVLHRHGWSHQTPARRAVERQESVIAGWVRETWPRVEVPRRRSTPGSSSKTRPASR